MGPEIFLNTGHGLVIAVCCVFLGYGAYLCLMASWQDESRTARTDAAAGRAASAMPPVQKQYGSPVDSQPHGSPPPFASASSRAREP